MKMMAHSRKLLLLLADDDEEATSASSSLRNNLSPTITYSPDQELLPPLNSSSSSSTDSPVLTNKPQNSPFDSSMALTILVLLTALFFMAFFSVYIRRFSDDAADDLRRRRQHHSPPSSSSASSLRFRPSKGRGLDPSTVGSLPLIAYSAHATHPIDCAICLTEFEERETVKMIPCCRHVFHPGCIDTWLASHVSCPLCRSTKMYGAEEVCLSVMQVDNNESISEDLRFRSTMVESDTWTGEDPVGLRRTCSCSSLGQRGPLQRSRSF